MNVTILGAGNMGTALAHVIGQNGHQVKLWNHLNDQEPLEQIAKFQENKKYLFGVKLSSNVQAEPDLTKALANVKAIIIAVPSKFIIDVVKNAAPLIKGKVIFLDASKGLSEKLEIIPTIIQKILPTQARPYVGSLSGPAVAVDLAKGSFAAMDIATANPYTIKIAKQILENDHLKLVATKDIIGVELAGCLKNIYAIALGIATELKYPLNTISALIVAALKEMSKVVKTIGGKPETVFGLSGIGDLIGTGLCAKSRNHRFGACLARGLCAKEAMEEIKQIVEGIPAANAISQLEKKYKLKLPLVNLVTRCINGSNAKNEMEKYLKSYC